MGSQSISEGAKKYEVKLDNITEQEITIAAIQEKKSPNQKIAEIIDCIRQHPEELVEICQQQSKS